MASQMNVPLVPFSARHVHHKVTQARASTRSAGTHVRHELKYLVTPERVEAVKTDLGNFLLPDVHASTDSRHRYTVRSLYFDTPNIRFYYEKLDGANCRSKVRLRRYEISGARTSDWFFEIKSKYHNICVKPRRLQFHDAL